MLRVQADDRGKQRLRPGSLLGHSVSEGAEVTVLHARMSKDAQYSCVFSISSYLHTNEGGCALPIWNLPLAFIVQEKISTSHTGPVTIRYRVIGITRFCSNAKSSDSSLIDESVRLLRSWAPMIRKWHPSFGDRPLS